MFYTPRLAETAVPERQNLMPASPHAQVLLKPSSPISKILNLALTAGKGALKDLNAHCRTVLR
jgi:hypothetical protein